MFIRNLHAPCSGCSNNQDVIMRNKTTTLRTGSLFEKDLEKDFETLTRLMMRLHDQI